MTKVSYRMTDVFSGCWPTYLLINLIFRLIIPTANEYCVAKDIAPDNKKNCEIAEGLKMPAIFVTPSLPTLLLNKLNK